MEKRTILFVDDEPNVTGGLKRSFYREPYTILSANSAKEAIEVLADKHVDVVVSDEQMPGMAGSELLAVVREKYPDTIRIILTGQATLEAAIRAINAGGVYRFFTKPCNEVDLKMTIRQALQQRELAAQGRRLLRECREQSALLEGIERANPGITHVVRDTRGAILLDADDSEDLDSLLKAMARFGGVRAPASR